MTKEGALTAAGIAAPSVGPTVLIIFGLHIPIAAMGLSMLGLFLARYIAPKPTRRLTIWQERALTVLLAVLLIVIVSGNAPIVGDGKPLAVGMATAWGIGLGTSGIVAVELIGSRMMAMLRAMFAGGDDKAG